MKNFKDGFRPLDGESISKLNHLATKYDDQRWFPSPRRGINF